MYKVDTDDITDELIALADKYDLPNLEKICIPPFIKNIDVGNCLHVYIIGYLHNFEEIKNEAFKVIEKNWDEVEKSYKMLDERKAHPKAVMEIMSKIQK